MKFSVLIANYNNSRFLKTALNSVINQSYKNWEVILIDDCSTDNFHEVIEEYLEEERLLIFSNKLNMGCGYTKNRCTKLASGDIFGFLDPDDKLEEHALQTMVEAHQLYPDSSIVYSTHYVCDEDLTIKRIAEYVREVPANTPYLLLNDGRIHHFAAFKQKSYKKTAGINEKLKKAVDQDLYYKLEEVGMIKYIPRPLYHYRIHPGGISTMGKEAETNLIHFEIIREHCLKRLKMNTATTKQTDHLRKAYRMHYHKVSAFYWSRKRKWLPFMFHLLIFPFVGGGQNIRSYVKKIPLEGISLIKKSFISTHQIK